MPMMQQMKSEALDKIQQQEMQRDYRVSKKDPTVSRDTGSRVKAMVIAIKKTKP
jgi:hypothetical protein